jgi:hypothetical protein
MKTYLIRYSPSLIEKLKVNEKIILHYFILILYIMYNQIEINNKEIYLVFLSGIMPIKFYDNLASPENLRSDLHRVGGVYGIINISENKKKKTIYWFK